MECILDALACDAAVYFFTLWAPLATVIALEEKRAGRPPLGDRVAGCWSELEAVRDELGTIIDALAALDRIVRSLIARIEMTDGKIRANARILVDRALAFLSENPLLGRLVCDASGPPMPAKLQSRRECCNGDNPAAQCAV